MPAPSSAASTAACTAGLVLLNVFYIREHHTKLTRHILQRMGSGTFVQAVLLCLLNTIPKAALLAALHTPARIREFSSALSGSMQISFTISFAAVLIAARTDLFIHHTSFYKDIVFLEGSHVLMLVLISTIPQLVAPSIMALGLFALFAANTLTLPEYIALPTVLDAPPSAKTHSPLYLLRAALNMLLLDPSLLDASHPKTPPYSAALSPAANIVLVLLYFQISPGIIQTLLLSLLALGAGAALFVLARRRVLVDILCIYSLAASILFCTLTMRAFAGLAESISTFTGLGTQFVSGTVLALHSNLAEIITCTAFSRTGASTLAACSVIYTHPINTTLVLPLIKLLLSSGLPALRTDIRTLPFTFFSFVFSLAEMKVIFTNYMLRNCKFTKDLGYTLLAIYLLFTVGFSIEGRAHLCK